MVPVAKIIKTRGIKGEIQVRVSPDSYNVANLVNRELFLRLRNHQQSLILEHARPYRDRWILKFRGIDDIRQAYRLVGYQIYSRERPPADEPVPLAGWRVIDSESGILQGRVVGSERHGQNVLIAVEDPGRRVFLVPVGLIRQKDPGRKEVRVELPGGLTDLN